jgi:hypothetical protein
MSYITLIDAALLIVGQMVAFWTGTCLEGW